MPSSTPFHDSPKKHARTRRAGFTLIELLVAMTLFMVVISVAVGGFVRALRIQRQLSAFVAANGNVSLAIEQIAREIRTGRDFNSPQRDTLTFTNASGEKVTYAYDADLDTLVRQAGVGNPEPIVSQTIVLKSVVFEVQGNAVPADRYPTRVTIGLVVVPKANGIETSEVRLQTTVSARSLGT
jgi:prepilin-type N-terminal cleavage/methylation domain-containing protein